jgi:nickel-dependent lactate racemase
MSLKEGVEMKIFFPYGNSSLKAELPTKNLISILRAKEKKHIKKEKEYLIERLGNPIGSSPLSKRVSKGDKIAIIVTDNTRACPDSKLLPPILKELKRGGIKRKDIEIMIALGLHKPLSKTEMVEKLGKVIVEKYKVTNHSPQTQDCINLGKNSKGIPIELNKKVVEADFRISTGFIEPHFFAGFSGGRKSIMPGISSRRAIYKNHSYNMIDHPNSRAGILQGNLIHKDMIEHAKKAKLNFIVNVLLNKRKEIIEVVTGDLIKAHEKGCELERDIAGAKVDHKVDITITTNSGAPLDLDLYQTVKGIDNASQITRDGGIIIIASKCNRGIGPEMFRKLHSEATFPSEILERIKRNEPIESQWENQVLARVQLNKKIYLLSDMKDNIIKDMIITPIHSIEEGLEKSFKEVGKDAEIVAIPDGPTVLPRVSMH